MVVIDAEWSEVAPATPGPAVRYAKPRADFYITTSLHQTIWSIGMLTFGAAVLWSTANLPIRTLPNLHKAVAAITCATQPTKAKPMAYDTEMTPPAETAWSVSNRKELDQFYLAATMWGEARGQGVRGMRMVGEVMMNRIAKDPDRFGYTLPEAARRRKQFSCWNVTDPNYRLLNRVHLARLDPGSADGKAWHQAKRIAAGLLDGSLGPDITHGSTHYAVKGYGEKWNLSKLLQFGAHEFFE